MKQLARVPQKLFALWAAELVRRDGTDESMASGRGIALQDQLSCCGQRGNLCSQPSQHPPDGAVVESPLVNVVSVGPCHIADDSVAGLGRFPIRLPVILDVSGGQLKERWPGVAFIREYENRDNR
jgi:hypothetical protein